MSYMLVHHKVEDYNTWRPQYDGHLEARKKAGLKEVHVLRNTTDPQDIFILFEASDLKKAQDFGSSDDLRETMQKAGVKGKPDVYFLNEGEQPFSRPRESVSGYREPTTTKENRR